MRAKQRVEIKKFNNLNINSNEVLSEAFYNYKVGKALTNSSGVKVASFPINSTSSEQYQLKIAEAGIEKVDGIAYFKQYFPENGKTTHRLLVYGSDQKVYINQMLDDIPDLYWLYNLTFSSAPITLAYKKDDNDAIILASKNEMKIWKTGYSPYTIEDVPIITSMCMNDGVLFCTIKEPAFKIWYATDLDAEKVGLSNTGSGYVSLEDDLGYARKIITYNEEVYVFRDYGISKVNYIKGEVSFNQIYVSGTKIYTDTVALCGNEILFLTKNGVYSFNGVKVTKTEIELPNLNFENVNATATSLADRYYLALRLDFGDERKILCENENYINNALLIFDTINKSYEIIRGVDIKTLLPIKTEEFEKMLVTFNTMYTNLVGEISSSSTCMQQSLPKLWRSGDLVNNVQTKLFTKLSVVADEGVKVKLIYDNKSLSFTTYQNGVNQFMFKIHCKQIKLEISSENDSGNVDKVVLDYYEY